MSHFEEDRNYWSDGLGGQIYATGILTYSTLTYTLFIPFMKTEPFFQRSVPCTGQAQWMSITWLSLSLQAKSVPAVRNVMKNHLLRSAYSHPPPPPPPTHTSLLWFIHRRWLCPQLLAIGFCDLFTRDSFVQSLAY